MPLYGNNLSSEVLLFIVGDTTSYHNITVSVTNVTSMIYSLVWYCWRVIDTSGKPGLTVRM